MNIKEIDKWLDNEYGMSYTRLEELHNYFFEKYTDQKEEIERLNNIINEILTFGIYKEECPMTLDFEDNCLEGKAQKDFDIYMNCDEHCGCGLEDNHNECWLKYFERLQELKGSDKE